MFFRRRPASPAQPRTRSCVESFGSGGMKGRAHRFLVTFAVRSVAQNASPYDVSNRSRRLFVPSVTVEGGHRGGHSAHRYRSSPDKSVVVGGQAITALASRFARLNPVQSPFHEGSRCSSNRRTVRAIAPLAEKPRLPPGPSVSIWDKAGQ